MKDSEVAHLSVEAIIRDRLGEKAGDYCVPPPVFAALQAEFLSFELESAAIELRMPVLEEYLNPYGALQGGIIAAAVDNALGPLSMLHAPPNVTRRLDMKYSRPVTPELEYIVVTARLQERRGRWLTFRAEVRGPDGLLLARARAVHWIIEPDESPPS